MVPTFGSNGALWSLANEFWYYIAFALLLTGVFEKRWTLRVAAMAGAALVGLTVGAEISLYFLIWLMGVAINFTPRLRRGGGIWVGVSLSALMLALLAAKSLRQAPGDFTIGLASTALIYALLQSSARSAGGLFAALSHRLANMSYTLYAIHLPLAVFIAAWVLKARRWYPDPLHLALGLLVVAMALLYAALVARFTEAKTGTVREAFSKRFARSAVGVRLSEAGPG
jgi:peptidoglycan/LPS O-acetylase OafA/YrhL